MSILWECSKEQKRPDGKWIIRQRVFFLISSSELYSLQIKRIHYAIGSTDEYNTHTHTHTHTPRHVIASEMQGEKFSTFREKITKER